MQRGPGETLLLSLSLTHSLSVDSIPDTKQMARLQPPSISLPKHGATPAPATHSQTDSWHDTLQISAAASQRRRLLSTPLHYRISLHPHPTPFNNNTHTSTLFHNNKNWRDIHGLSSVAGKKKRSSLQISLSGKIKKNQITVMQLHQFSTILLESDTAD